MSRPRVKSTVHLAAKTLEERKEIAKSGNIHKLGLVKESVKVMPNGSPALLPKRTGKVYIEHDDEKLELMEGAYYSNFSMEVYDANGNNLADDLAKYHGRKHSVQFTLHDKDRFGKYHNFVGAFLSPYPWGDLGKLDWAALHDAEQTEAEQAIVYGVLSGYDDPYLNMYVTHGASTYCVYCCSDMKFEDYEPFRTWMGFTLVFDDQVDSNKFFDKSLTYDELHTVREKLWEVLDFKKLPEEQQVDFEMPQMIQSCRFMKHTRDAVLRIIQNEEVAQRFFDDIKNYLNSAATVNSAEWNEYKENCKVGTEHRAHWNLRRWDSGMHAVCHLNTLTYLCKLPNHIYHNPLWEYYRRRCTDHNVCTNDIFSYRKEMVDGETCNAVYNYHYGEKLDFMDALQSVMNDANRAAIDMWEVGKFLLKIYNNDPELARAIKVLQIGALGHVMFYNHALQYHNGVVFNLVIHKDEWDSAIDKIAREEQLASG